MSVYTEEERRIALVELGICLRIVDGILAEWRDPDGCAYEIAHTLRDRYDVLKASIHQSNALPRSC